jgi:hypothetical protein
VKSIAPLLHFEFANNMKSEKHLVGAKLLCVLLLFVAAPDSFAIIRSPYPAKSLPPDRGHMIITIGDDSIVLVKDGR